MEQFKKAGGLVSLLMMLVISKAATAQKEPSSYSSIVAILEKAYNAGDYKSIFGLFSPEMQQFLPLEKTTEFFTGLKADAGNIKTRQFIPTRPGQPVLYKTNFERGVLGMHVTLNEKSKISGLILKPYVDRELPKPARNLTKLSLPFRDEWTVIWGGDTKAQNYHVESEAQKNAFDLIITNKEGKSFKTDGKQNEDYYAFGKEILVPCAGEVVLVVDGVKDNKPGELNPIYVPGNSVIIKTLNNEYLFFAHFKQHSIRVKQGDRVERGKVLGLCGNSGNSSEPHLHFHIQNVEDMNIATGIKCYFETVVVNGVRKNDYSPVQSEKIRN